MKYLVIDVEKLEGTERAVMISGSTDDFARGVYHALSTIKSAGKEFDEKILLKYFCKICNWLHEKECEHKPACMKDVKAIINLMAKGEAS